MNSLKRQASKAERYAKLRDEMRAKLRVLLASRFAQLDAEAAALDPAAGGCRAGLRMPRAKQVQQMEAEHGERAQRGYAIERESQENREQLNTLTLEIDRAAERRRTNLERSAELDARSAGAQAEIADAEEQFARLQQELETNRATLESANADVANAQQELQQRRREASEASAWLTDVEKQQERRRDAILQTVSAASAVRNRITQAEERRAALDREAQRLHEETTAANQQLESFGGQLGQLGRSSRPRSGSTLSPRRSPRCAGISKRSALQRLQASGIWIRYAASMPARWARKGSLESGINEHGYATESVRRLFTSGAMKDGLAPVGVLADFLEVEDRYEHVVDDFLREELNYIVVKSWDAADEGLRLLRSDVDGRATFLVHPEDSQAKFSFLFDESSHRVSHGDSVVPLKHCIRVLNGFGKSLEVILPKLGTGYIVPDQNAGRDLALENPNAFFLSQSGECFHNVTVTGGKQRSQGPLSMKRELREVSHLMGELERAMAEQETRVSVLGREIAELTGLLDRLEDDKRESERQAMTSGSYAAAARDGNDPLAGAALHLRTRTASRNRRTCGACDVRRRTERRTERARRTAAWTRTGDAGRAEQSRIVASAP